jgi:oxygen-independent coproporphyrinogen-3 oxidase
VDEIPEKFTGALLKETDRRLREWPELPVVPSVYLGGGTPSLLGAAGIERLFSGLRALLGTGPREITMEANPESAGADFLRFCAEQGVNRLSLGIQSFSAEVRAAAGRRCGERELEKGLEAAVEIFGRGLSLDLMTGLPGQSPASAAGDIQRALSFQPGHISLYALTGKNMAGLPSGDEADKLWIDGRDALSIAGYRQYEVSNFAPDENHCLHNMRYWRMENWIGVGPSASGTFVNGDGTGSRSTYAADTAAFIADPAQTLLEEDLSRAETLRETLLMGFRCAAGPDPVLFRTRFGRNAGEFIPRTLEKWKNFLQPGGTALNKEGLLLLNRFLLDAFQELDNY